MVDHQPSFFGTRSLNWRHLDYPQAREEHADKRGGMETSENAYLILAALRSLAGIGVESNDRSFGALTRTMSERLRVHVVDLSPVIEALQAKGYIQLENRPGFSTIYRATATDRGLAYLEHHEAELEAEQAPTDDTRRLVFVSCGQHMPAERAIGKKLAAIITSETSKEGFFAQNESSLEALSSHILEALNTCAGFVGVLHKRGAGRLGDIEFERASVWVEQEIAIAAFLVQVLRRDIPVQLYIQRGIELAGIRQQLATSNWFEFETEDQIEEHFRAIVCERFGPVPPAPAERDDSDANIEVAARPRNLDSPLNPKPWPHVTVWADSSEEPVFGLEVKPLSYSTTVKILAADDDEQIRAAELTTRLASLHEQLNITIVGASVVLASPTSPREDGRVIVPDQQIEVVSDGDLFIRLRQNDNAPLYQLLALFGIAYTFVRKLYPRFGLALQVQLSTTIRTAHGTSTAPPIGVPRWSKLSLEADLALPFAGAFGDLLIATMRDGGESLEREVSRQILETFARDVLHST